MSQKENALISVYDKTGLDEFADGLVTHGFNIYASGGTAKKISESGIEVTDVSELVGGSAILGHRVVTLSREVYAGILAQKTPEDLEELERLGIPLIDLVAVDMYPLHQTIADPDSDENDVIEQTDIGGPTMLRAAAKGRRIVLSRVEQRPEVLQWLEEGRPEDEEFRRRLAGVAEYEVARYVMESALYIGGAGVTGFIGERVAVPKYGENPQQGNAGLYVDRLNQDPLGLGKFELVSGAELSYNNLTDIDRLLQTSTHVAAVFDKNFLAAPAMALGAKHGNVCGVGVGDDRLSAVKKMLGGDPRAIFGGSLLLNFEVDQEIADALVHHGMSEGGKRLIDVVVAPLITGDALDVLQRKGGKLRVVTNPALGWMNENDLDANTRSRYVRGGRLEQDNYTFVLSDNAEELMQFGPELTETQEQDMALAWAIGSTSNSNTVTLVKNGMLIGNGVGQQDRVSAAQLAIKRARDASHYVRGAVAYSDSFFPFPDGAETLADAGVAAILATRGSVNDSDVIDALVSRGVAFYTLPDSSSRGFFGH